MNNAEYIALAGKVGASNSLRVASNNASNAATVGFKADGVLFQKWMHQDVQKQDTMPTDAKTFINHRQGELKQTGNRFDFAIVGSGFFAVADANGVLRLTRNGKFTLSSEGILQDMHGRNVVDVDGGIIDIGQNYGTFDVISDGRMFINENEVGSIGVFGLAPNEQVKKGNYGDFIITELPESADMAKTSVKQGMTEVSNVDPMLGLFVLTEINKQVEYNNMAANTNRDNIKAVYRIFSKSGE